ncbi:Tat pathway signal protein [Corynebacterium matruchotii]
MNPTHIVASGGMLPLTSPGSDDDMADSAAPADIVPVVALAATVNGVPVVRLIPETLLTAETFIMGRLGLEPQPQPRQLGRSRPRAIGFPAWPIMTDPDNAEHALNLVADIEWAKKVAKSQDQKVWDRFEELAQMLSTAAPHFVPTLLEELARIFDDSGSPNLAVRAFGKAREFERTYNLPVDFDRHRHALTEFARRGVISAKEMGFEATSCMRRIPDPEAAYQYFLGLIIDQVSAGSAPYAGLPRDFLRVAKPTGRTPQQAGKELLDSISELSGMRRVPVGFVKALGKHMSGLLDHRPDAVMQLISTPPTDYYPWSGNHKLEDWTTVFITIGGPNILKENPAYFRRWFLTVLDTLVGRPDYSPSLVDLIASNSETISGIELDETHLGLPLELIEALIVAGAQWHLDNVSYEENNQLESFLDRIQYYRDHRHKNLTHCLENPQIKTYILCGWTLERLMEHGDAVAQVNNTLLHEELLHDECRHLRAAPLPTIDRFVTSLTRAVKAQLPLGKLEHLVEKENVNAATVLAANLAHGLITELTWPELERHIHAMRDELSPERGIGPRLQITESYPGVVAFCGTKVAAVAGDTTLLDTRISTKHTPFDMISVPDVDGTRVLALGYSGGDKISATWNDGEDVSLLLSGQSYSYSVFWPRHSSLAIPDGRLVGDTILRATSRELNRSDDAVYGDNAGNMWYRGGDYSHGYEWRVYDPATDTHTRDQPPQRVVDLAEAAGIIIDWSRTTFLPAPVDNDAARAKIIPTTDTGEFCCVVGYTKDENRDYALVTGDGTRYLHDMRVCGATTFGGVTCLVGVEESGTVLYLPGVSVDYGTLATTRDDRGEPHWMYQLPWVAWGNLTLRDEEASRRLRAIQPADVAPLLAALKPDSGKRSTTTRNQGRDTSGERVYSALSSNCRPGSAAMQAAADLLGTDDRELCVSVVQLALSVRASVRKLTNVCNRARVQHKREALAARNSAATQEAPAPNAAHVDRSVRPAYAVVAKVRQLQEVIDGKRDASHIGKDYSWGWLSFAGQEKALVSWAMGPLTPPAARMEAAALLRKLADAKIDNRTWRQVLIDWYCMSKKLGKVDTGLLFVDADTQAIVLDTWHDVKRGTENRLLVAGDKFPETVCDASALGAAKTAHDLGVEPGMSAEEMRVWADKLEHMDDIDPGEWLSRMRPLIDALTARTFLTKTAAIMLLAGGFGTLLPRELAIAAFRRAGGDALRAAEEERAKTIRRKLKLTRKSTLAATTLLTRVDPMSRALLATAAFDNNTTLVDAFVASFPACELVIPDQLMEKYLAGQWAAPDEKNHILFQLLCPLKPKPQFSGWNGGMIASIALDLATNLPAQGFADDAEARKVCSFLAHQLTMLKTATNTNISGNHTSLPLTGDINHIKDGHYWSHNFDAFRGLSEGHFDKIIADLGDETKSRPAGCYRDPRVSAPAVVAEVRQELGLSEPAAVYFLQLLALVDPTDTNVKTWNGWKKKQLDEARAELIAHDLVVEGKRTGAGRTVFLPGVWWEAQSGSMPVEAWKSNFYLIRYRERCESTVRWCPPTEPFDQLFQTVWGRWLSGDRPSFDPLTTKKYRR